MEQINILIKRYPALLAYKNEIEATVNCIVSMHQNGGKLLLCGNGGSAADCEHISGELLKGFLLPRPLRTDQLCGIEEPIRLSLQQGIAAIPLPSFIALNTAFSNDVSPENAFAQLVFALGKSNDVLLCISTSGNAKNVCNAAKTAKALGIKTVALTGASGGELSKLCDIKIKAPEYDTFKIQELHLPIYHAICAEVEEILYGGRKE